MRRLSLFFSILFILLISAGCNPPDFTKYGKNVKLQPGKFNILQPDKNRRYRLDIITIEPGAEIYSAWGHTAIRIVDLDRNLDIVFDYGLFDFSEDFAIRFLKGQPAFMVGAFRYYDTLMRYKSDNRRIFTQQLKIPDKRIQFLLQSLIINIKPENNTFQYHHFDDNCTTRIRDRVDQALQGKYKAAFFQKKQKRSFRDGSMNILLGRPVLWTGTNLILGSSVDREIDQWQNQFLPMDLMIALDNYRNIGNQDTVGEIQVVLEPYQDGFQIDLSTWILPTFFIIALLSLFYIVPLVATDHKIIKYISRLGWFFWHLGSGLAGSILLITWLFTNHDTVYHNLNLLGFSPILLINIPVSLWLRYKKNLVLLTQIHQLLIIFPAIGFVLSLTHIINQFSWPFLGMACVIQIVIYLNFYQKEKILRKAR